MPKELFYKNENRLFHADTVTNKSTGREVKITNSLEKLYAYMLNQYRYRQSKTPKQLFYETQERLGIMARIGDPKKNAKKHIDALIDLGLVTSIGKKGRCHVYKVAAVDDVAHNLIFTYPVVDEEPTYNHEKRLSSPWTDTKESEADNRTPAQGEYDPDCPF